MISGPRQRLLIPDLENLTERFQETDSSKGSSLVCLTDSRLPLLECVLKLLRYLRRSLPQEAALSCPNLAQSFTKVSNVAAEFAKRGAFDGVVLPSAGVYEEEAISIGRARRQFSGCDHKFPLPQREAAIDSAGQSSQLFNRTAFNERFNVLKAPRTSALLTSDKCHSPVGDAQNEDNGTTWWMEQFRTCSSPVRDLLNPGSTLLSECRRLSQVRSSRYSI